MNHAAPLGMCLLPGMHVNVNPPPSPAAQGWEGTSVVQEWISQSNTCVVPIDVGRETLCVSGRAEPWLHPAAAAPEELLV